MKNLLTKSLCRPTVADPENHRGALIASFARVVREDLANHPDEAEAFTAKFLARLGRGDDWTRVLDTVEVMDRELAELKRRLESR